MWDRISMVSCQKGPTRHAYAWQIGPFWQDTLDMWCSRQFHVPMHFSEKFTCFGTPYYDICKFTHSHICATWIDRLWSTKSYYLRATKNNTGRREIIAKCGRLFPLREIIESWMDVAMIIGLRKSISTCVSVAKRNNLPFILYRWVP